MGLEAIEFVSQGWRNMKNYFANLLEQSPNRWFFQKQSQGWNSAGFLFEGLHIAFVTLLGFEFAIDQKGVRLRTGLLKIASYMSGNLFLEVLIFRHIQQRLFSILLFYVTYKNLNYHSASVLWQQLDNTPLKGFSQNGIPLFYMSDETGGRFNRKSIGK
jgi:hypothetical protein